MAFATATLLTVALLAQPQVFRCPSDVNYDIYVYKNHLAVLALYDHAECTIKGATAHCKVDGTSLSHGDVYDMPVTIGHDQVTVSGTVCRWDPTALSDTSPKAAP